MNSQDGYGEVKFWWKREDVPFRCCFTGIVELPSFCLKKKMFLLKLYAFV